MATNLLSKSWMTTEVEDTTFHNRSSPDPVIPVICCNGNITKVQIVAVLYICTSFLSILGAGSILVCSFWNKMTTSPEVQPLFHLTLANFFLALTWFIGGIAWKIDPVQMQCFYVEIFGEMFLIMSFFLTVNYGVHVYIRLRDRTYRLDNLKFTTVSTNDVYKWLFRGLYFASWVVPVLVVAPLISKYKEQLQIKDGPSCSRCLLLFDRPKLNPNKKEDVAWELYDSISLISCLGPSMIVLITLYITTQRIYRKCLRRTGIHTDSQRKSMTNMRKRIFLYVLVFMFCWTPALGIAIAEVARRLDVVNDSYRLECQTFVLQSISAPLQGFLNSIVYGWTRKSFRRAAQRSVSEQSSRSQTYGTMQPLTS